VKSTKPTQNRLALAQFLAPIEILPCNDIAALYCGKIQAHLQKMGTPIGSLDMLIAAHTFSRNP
jgi:tRNA(fMet)-specific endonuclease VapC